MIETVCAEQHLETLNRIFYWSQRSSFHVYQNGLTYLELINETFVHLIHLVIKSDSAKLGWTSFIYF